MGDRSNQPTARSVAANVLYRVYRQGAFAAATLDSELRSAPNLKPADRALATELVYGVLRTRGALADDLAQFAARGLKSTDERVMIHLLTAAYQLRYLERVPAFAAVDEAVSLVTQLRGKRVAGFCNAVLRRLSQSSGKSLGAAIEASVAPWLLAELRQAVGPRAALDLLGVPRGDAPSERTHTAPPSLRLRAGVQPPPWLASAVERGKTSEDDGVPGESDFGMRGKLFPSVYRLRGGGDLRRHAEYAAGQFVIQDEGSMFAAHALGVRPGERVLDACAGRGQKTSLLLERLENDGELWAVDKSARKLRELEQEMSRLQLPAPRTLAVDWTGDSAAVPRDFDRVIVDAPCSGSGTLRRRPEIALRLTRDDVRRLAELAETILRAACAHARPGGRVQFVVCSVLPEECEALVERVADVLEPADFDVDDPALAGRSQLRLLPSEHDTDGFFIASFRRR